MLCDYRAQTGVNLAGCRAAVREYWPRIATLQTDTGRSASLKYVNNGERRKLNPAHIPMHIPRWQPILTRMSTNITATGIIWMGKRPSHNRFCSFLRYHIFIIHRYTMLYCQRFITSFSFILSVDIIGSLHKFFNLFSTFSTIFIVFKKQNDSIDRISFCTLIKSHFFAAMYFIAAFIFKFFWEIF